MDKFFTTVCLLFIVTLPTRTFAGNVCLELFLRKTSHGPSIVRLEPGKELKFLSEDGRTLTTVRRFEDRGFLVDTIKQTMFLEAQTGELDALPMSSIREFSTNLAELIKLNYPRRGWPKHFIGKVSKDIETNFMTSDFIVIRDAATTEPITSMRLLNAPYLRKMSGPRNGAIVSLNGDRKLIHLPVESFFIEGSLVRKELRCLKTKVDLGKGPEEAKVEILFEVSSLVVAYKHEKRDTLVALLYKYFLFSAQQPTILLPNGPGGYPTGVSLYALLINNPSVQLLYAYGDPAGRLMYLPYGFVAISDMPAKEFMGSSWDTLGSSDEVFAKVRKRYDLGTFAGEAMILFNTNFPDYYFIKAPYWQTAPYDVHVEEAFTRRQNKIIGGVTPQYLDYLQRRPHPPREYQLEE